MLQLIINYGSCAVHCGIGFKPPLQLSSPVEVAIFRRLIFLVLKSFVIPSMINPYVSQDFQRGGGRFLLKRAKQAAKEANARLCVFFELESLVGSG